MPAWLTETTFGKLLQTFFISMLPVVELRGGIPWGVSRGLDYHTAALTAILGNLLPVPFIILFVRQVFAWLRKKSGRLDAWIAKMENKAELKGEKVKSYGAIGLILLVAIPLPGTGAWTGALVAAVLGLRMRDALPAIVIGVVIAAAIVLGMTYGVSTIF
ncbi:MAG: COG2426 family protein [Clostridia bacterium]